MNKKRTWIIRIATVLFLVLVSAVMMIIGRGHTVFLDNKAFTYGDTVYNTPYKISVYVNGESVAKLYDGERGMATCIGQNFKMDIEVMEVKGGGEVTKTVSVKLPYSIDKVVLNLPAILNDLPVDAYLTEFVSNIAEETEEETEAAVDEFAVADM